MRPAVRGAPGWGGGGGVASCGPKQGDSPRLWVSKVEYEVAGKKGRGKRTVVASRSESPWKTAANGDGAGGGAALAQQLAANADASLPVKGVWADGGQLLAAPPHAVQFGSARLRHN